MSNRFLGFEVPGDMEAMIGYGTFVAVMDALEGAVSGGGYVAGDRFTAADVYVGSHIGWGLQIQSIEKRAAFEDYWARLVDRDAWRKATELDDALQAERNPPA